MNRSAQQSKKFFIWIFVCSLFIALGVVFIIPTSYYLVKPGKALEVRSFVQMEGKKSPKGGNFLLTTVSLKQATIFDYVTAQLVQDTELLLVDKILISGESNKEYDRRQQEYMLNSQENAIIAAYHEANRPVRVVPYGVEVYKVDKEKSALLVGDLIQKVDQKVIKKSEELIQFLKNKKVGETVKVQLLRQKKKITETIRLVSISEDKVGVGIKAITRVKVKTEPKVHIEVGKIGGPSAGLMFALEVFNQLSKEDLTKGYQIAGTGTISSNGKVGQIGGIEQKVLAASRAGVHVFFCPKDIEASDNNEKLAKEKQTILQTEMKIVPVKNIKDALSYLRNL